MNADRFERMCKEVLESHKLSEETKTELVKIYAAEYRAWSERQGT